MSCSKPKQRKIDTFYRVTSPVSSQCVIMPIIEELLTIVCKTKKMHTTALDATTKSWCKGFPWLSVTHDTTNEVRLKCALCSKHKMGGKWATEGVLNIQKSNIERHCTSREHLDAERVEIKKSSGIISESESEDDVGDLSKQDLFLFRTIYCLMKSETPLNRLDTILELQRLNGVDLEYQNLSWTTVSEIQNIIAEGFTKDLVSEINSSNFYAILIDESTDIRVSKRLSVCVRYVKNGQPVTTFLASTEISDGGAYTVVGAVHSVILSLGLDLTKCVSLATDGASVMMGKKTGVGVQLKSKFSPYMTQTHCIAHRLNLAIGDAIKKNETLKQFKQMFETLYHFMSASTARMNKLKAVQDLLNEPEISIKEPHSIRWLGLKKAVEAVYDCYGALLVTLSSFACDNPTAKGLHKYFTTYKTALLVGLMLDIHTELGVLSCDLQRQSLVFSDVYPLLEGTVEKLEYMKEHDGNGLHEMKNSIEFKTQSDDEEEPKPSYKGESLKYYKKGKSDSEFQTVKNDYIDSLARNIKKRISKVDCNVLCSLGLLLEPASYSTECDNAVEYIAQMYGTQKVTKKTVEDVVIETPVDPLLNGDELKTEWQGIKAMVTGCYKSLSLKAFCRKIIQSSLSTSYPNFAKLAEIGLCMEVTSVECERTFSTQNRLKNKYRAALKEESLEALLTVSLLGPSLSQFKPAGSVRRWVRTKQRRKRRLTAPYKSRTLKNIMSKSVE